MIFHKWHHCQKIHFVHQTYIIQEIIANNSIIKIGYPIYSIYGYETEGIFQTPEEIENAPAQFGSLQPGNIRYKDQLTVDTDGDGVMDAGDGVINADDRVIIGDQFPRFTYGINLNAGYKGFDLGIDCKDRIW